ncbi:MAG: efflux RND transporter periplasmic adaptor subunit, partial [Candidatus Hydrogenedentales bacterium]
MTEIQNPKSKIQNPKSPKNFPGRILFVLKFIEIRLRFIFILVVTAVVVGYWDNIQNYYERWQRTHATQQMLGLEGDKDMSAANQEFEYYCGMHPFVVRDHSDKCPICGMDLVQRKKGAPMTLPEGTLARVQVSPQRIMQGGIQVEPVLYRMLTRTIRSYGEAEPAEGRLAIIAARFPGRVQELMVNAVGLTVKKGDPLARIYSPKYLAASQEYVRAVSNEQKGSAISSPDMAALEKTRSEQLVIGARKRLSLAGFTDEQLDAIVES